LIIKYIEKNQLFKKLNYKRNTTINFFEFFFQSLNLLLFYKISTFYLSLNVFGTYVLVITYASFIKLLDFGLSNSTIRYLSVSKISKNERKEIINNSFTVYIFFFSIISLVFINLILLFDNYFLNNFENEINKIEFDKLIKLSAIYIYLSLISSFFYNLTRGLHQVYKFSAIKIISLIIQIIILYLIIKKYEIFSLLYVQIIHHIFLIIAGYFVIFNTTGYFPKIIVNFNKKILVKLLRFGIKFYFTSSLNLLFETVQKLFINHFGNLSYLAIYEIVYRIMVIFRSILAIPVSNFYPVLNFLYSTKKNFKSSFYQNKIKSIYLKKISLILYVLLILFSYPLSLFLFEEKNNFFTICIFVLAIGYYINLYTSSIYLEYLSKEIFSKLIISNSIGILLFVFLSILLGNIFSTIGIIFSIMVSMLISSLYLLITYEK